jgi:O-antigen ligase
MLSQYGVFGVLLFGFDRGFSYTRCESLIYYGLLTIPVTVILEALLAVLGFPIGYAWFGNFEETVRYVGIAGDTAQASMLCLLTTSIALFRLFGPNGRPSSPDVAILLVSLLGNVLTGTRGSVVCLFATLVFFYAINPRIVRKTQFLVIIFVALACAAIIGNTIQGSLLAVSRFFEEDAAIVSAERVVPMVQALDLAFSHPILGVGFGNSFAVLGTFVSDEIGFVGSFNQYLNSFVETGIVGALLTLAFLAFLTLELRRAAQHLPHAALLQGAYLWVLVLVVAYQTETWISAGSRISMVFFAVSAVALRLSRRVVERSSWAAAPIRA